ncbi:MAG: hypothetical protein M1457_12665 [bacterium]|nr:hypothetical protein [bacterium]
MKTRAMKIGWVCLTLLVVAGISRAAVVSPSVTVRGRLGLPVEIPFQISADSEVAGINGQLNFDIAFFSNPQIILDDASYGFIALGNESQPGQFKFVIYADPTQTVRLNAPLVKFRLDVVGPVTTRQLSTITYTLAAAGDPQGVSLPAVQLADSYVDLTTANTSAHDWQLYE